MRILVTGGAGFIGANLCRLLCEHEQVRSVTVLDDLSSGSLDNLVGLDLRCEVGSILDQSLTDRLARDCDAIVHLAAVPSVPRSVADPRSSHDANTTGTLNVLEAARAAGNRHVTVASSSSVYGSNPRLPKSEDLLAQPVSPYAATKLATETYALAWQSSYGLPTLAFRFFNVYGPLQPAGHAYAAVIPAFLDAAIHGRALQVHGDGTQSRDFTFVDTVAQVLTDAAIRRVSSATPINLAFGSRTDLLDVIRRLEGLLCHSLEVEHTEPRLGDVAHSQAANAELLRRFPDITPIELDVGLARTLAWFQERAAATG